ncbi:MAG: hypothetical protein C0467_26575 [Planctomycetaceae bacterium]|nr:hypothetical protein [Planctomycetaceae bacterium]
MTSVQQKSLMVAYRLQHHLKTPPLTFRDVGLRVQSQHDEDGILLFIFALIGTTNRKCVEICAGDGIECNTANLLLNHRWTGALFDGSEANVAKCKQFYANHPDTRFWPPAVAREWMTRSNVNSAIESQGTAGPIDLLSLDIDGIDYWLWEAITCVTPRVVVLEFNHLWGARAAVTVPYRDDFVAEFTQYGSDYAGASLPAFVKLGRRKGYRLVGTNAIATNAFFVHDDIVCDWLPEVDPATCFDHPRAQFGMTVRYEGIKNKAWVEV